jgi:Protein of unknown function (DUF1573).
MATASMKVGYESMMQFLKKCSFFTFLLALFYFAGTVLDVAYYHFFGPGLWHATISCDAPSQDLGIVMPGDTPDPSLFIVKNSGNASLLITEVRAGCGGCVEVIDFPCAEIAPCGQGTISARLLPINLSGPVNKSIIVRSNDPVHPVMLLHIKGVVLSFE